MIPHSSSQAGLSSRNGFALLATLWLIVAISAVGLEIAIQAKDRRQVAMNVSERGQATAAANAGIATVQSRLGRMIAGSGGLPGSSYIPNTDPEDPLEFADSLLSETQMLGPGLGGYTVYVKDAGTILSIYNMTEERWRGLLEGVGVDYGVADQLAQAIADWTDFDNDKLGRGAERNDYISAGRLIVPSNSPLGSVSELKDIMGMTSDIYARISPYLMFGTQMKVNVNRAEAPVLRSLPGMTEDAVSAIMSRRYSRTKIRSMEELLEIAPGLGTETSGQPSSGLPLSMYVGFRTEEVFVSSVGVGPGGSTQATIQAVLRQSTGMGQQSVIQVRSRRSW